jgi:hypothetical protein
VNHNRKDPQDSLLPPHIKPEHIVQVPTEVPIEANLCPMAVISVTPDIAADWLKLDWKGPELYDDSPMPRAMFNVEGLLVLGYHWLRHIVATGKPLDIMTTWDVAPEIVNREVAWRKSWEAEGRGGPELVQLRRRAGHRTT